jgi:hypothetical protein
VISDLLLLGGGIVIGTYILLMAHDIFERCYWAFIDWKYPEEKD